MPDNPTRRMYHYHMCPICKERWACGGAFGGWPGRECPGFTTGPTGAPQQKAVDAPHRYHKVLDVEAKP